MSLARSSTRLLQQIVDRAHDRRAAGEIAQALDIVVGWASRIAFAARRRRGVLAEPLVEHRRDVLERRDRDLDRPAEHDFGGANGRGIARVGDREPKPPSGELDGKIVVSRRKRRENRSTSGGCGEQLRQAEPRQRHR